MRFKTFEIPCSYILAGNNDKPVLFAIHHPAVRNPVATVRSCYQKRDNKLDTFYF